MMYKGKPILSSVSLAFSILFKQEALFILPAFVFWYFVKYRTKSWKGIALLICILFVVSAPFLIISPVGYLNGVTSGSLGVVYSGPNFLRSTMTLPSPTSATTQACTQILASTLNSSQIVCGLTYSWGKPSPGYLLVTMLEWVVYLAVFPIFVLTAFLLFLSRKRNNILELSCALSLIGFLLLFSLSVHSLLVYYFIPVYALLFASARGRSTLSVLIITSILSVFTPDKSYVPALLTLLSLTAIILVDKQGVTGTVPKVLKESGTGENNGTTEHSSVAIVRR
ncbi:MAG: hypothetical protein M1587_03700 [Thaumarchaeota archaeon]|nr:hypothetical protein [Nitrososphaerota archaeon]